jgi:ATP-binding cassette, subfamily B, multidrug efflux pump
MFHLFRYLRPYRWTVAAVLVLVLLQSFADLYLPTLMADIVDKGIVAKDIPYIWEIGGFMLLITLGGALVSITASFLSSKASAGFGRIVRGKVFGHVEKFSLQEFDKIGTASLITRTTNDINQVQQVLMMMMRMMVMAPMMCIGGIIMAVSKDPVLSLVLVAILPVLGGAIYLIASRGIPYFKVMQTKLDRLNLVLREALTGIRVIRSFNRIDREKGRFDDANRDLTDTAVKVNQIMAFMWPVMMLIINFSSIAIIWYGGLRINSGHIQIGDLMAFIQYAMQIMFSLMMLSMMFIMVPRASASAVRINEVLNMEPLIKDGPDSNRAVAARGWVEFDKVRFSYPGAEQPALDGITFTAKPGEVTAIIGGTGSGKSTLLSLIPRFYDVNEGCVRIGGTDVREMPQERLRSCMGLVPQKPVLFTGTVGDNIRFGKDDAEEDEIRHAADVAQATEFIAGMTEEFDSVISQGGTNVSGGQKQRLSIARAIVRRPDIYLFDDSFSALDFRTDAMLRAALRKETMQATVLIVAQRVTTVMDADRILVLEEGKIVGNGTHAELMTTSPVYREIVESQLSEEEIA